MGIDRLPPGLADGGLCRNATGGTAPSQCETSWYNVDVKNDFSHPATLDKIGKQ